MLSSLFPLVHERYAALPVLGELLDEFCEWLRANGYPPNAIRRRVTSSRLLVDILRRHHIRSFRELTEGELRALAPRPTGWTAQIARSLIRSLILFLRERAGLAEAQRTAADSQVAAYCRHLVTVRGLAPTTVRKHAIRVSGFLQFVGYDTRPEGLRDLQVSEVEAFIVQAGRRLGRDSMQHLAATLRSFFRFAESEGVSPSGMDAYVEAPRSYRGERLPRALPWKSVRLLLHSVDRSTQKGRRDYAILLMIAVYGLRAGEIAALKVEDVSWRSRQIRVPRPKIGTPLALPLTDEVATALVDYLRSGRPASTCRHLFLRLRIPIGPIESTAVCDVFDAWAARASIRLPSGSGGPHCLRHSLAVHLLRQKASTKTIGDLLGHRSVESTEVYLRLQVEDLRDVALPLPGSASPESES